VSLLHADCKRKARHCQAKLVPLRHVQLLRLFHAGIESYR
jgi:hypothetical protein